MMAGEEGRMLSSAALEMMKHIAGIYLSKSGPNHRVWWFERPEGDSTFRELSHGHGLIERGVGGPAERYRLTDFGHRWVMAYRELAVADAAY
jgi:hypothetical protein